MVGIGADGGATHRTVAMRKTLPLLTVSLLLIGLVGSAFATTIIDKPTFFASSNGSYITFSPSLLPLTFSTLYRGSDGYWNFNSTKIKTTVSMTITVFCGGNWTNYTVSGAGTQNIYNGSKPDTVILDGLSRNENNGWTYSGGTTTVTTATASVNINFGSASISTPTDEDDGFAWPDWTVYLPNFSLNIYTTLMLLGALPLIVAMMYVVSLFVRGTFPPVRQLVEVVGVLAMVSFLTLALVPVITAILEGYGFG